MRIRDWINWIETKYPVYFKESWDTVGLLIPPEKDEIGGIVVSLSLTENAIRFAEKQGANLIVTHHPLWLGSLNSLSGDDRSESFSRELIRKGIGLYTLHTNFDIHQKGMNDYLAKALRLEEIETLDPLMDEGYMKLEFTMPKSHEKEIFKGLFEVGAGRFGNYDSCSFASHGFGSFRPLEGANPFIGTEGKRTIVEEVKGEVIIPKEKALKAIDVLKKNHPYEEVAYFLYPICLKGAHGLGKVGRLKEPKKLSEVLKDVKTVFGLKKVAITYGLEDPVISKVSLSGGSGKHLLPLAMMKSDLYLTGDLTYHDFEKAHYNTFPLADIGHYESEQAGFKCWWEEMRPNLEVPSFFLEEEGCYQETI